MTIGVLRISLRIHGCTSLKEKRMCIRPIMERTRNKFHVATAEVGEQNTHHLAELAFVTVSSSDKIANSTCDKIIDFVEGIGLAELADQQIELIKY